MRGFGAAGQPTLTSRGTRVLVGSSPSGFDSELNQFTSEEILVSTMPKAAVDIAMESVCVSTRTKYNAMFKKFVFYGQSVGTNLIYKLIYLGCAIRPAAALHFNC